MDDLTLLEMRASIQELTLTVAHLVAMLGGMVEIREFESEKFAGAWLGIQHNGDGSATLRVCESRSELDAENAAIAARNAALNARKLN